MLREKIVGAWRLVSYVEQDDRGGPVTFPLGRDAVGLIMYTPDGYMSAQLMRSGRHGYDEPDIDGGTVQQAAAAAEGYLAYSGPYESTSRPASFTTGSRCRCCRTGWTRCKCGTVRLRTIS